MFEAFRVPIGWGTLLTRTVRESLEDNALGLAAQLAFYFFLALFPALLFLVALVSYLPIRGVMDELLLTMEQFTPPEVLTIIRDQLQAIAEGQHGGLLTIGILGTLWSSSLALNGIIDAINRAYGIRDSRSFLKIRFIAILLTIALSVFIIASFALVITGPQVAEHVAAHFGLSRAVELAWKILQWPIVFALVVTAVGIVYYVAPDAQQEWIWITPGAVLATVLWLVTSLGFRVYVVEIGPMLGSDYAETYGTIGGMIVLMLWFYLTGLAIVVGAELNAEIELASPHGKAPGERKPGERLKIGALAAREYAERKRARALGAPREPVFAEGNCDLDRAPAPQAPPRASELLIGSLAMLPMALRAGTKRRKELAEGDGDD
jgi:membrane protein